MTFAYRSNATLQDLAQRLRAAQRVLILSHGKPDGDAIGSALGLHRALRAAGTPSDIHLFGPVERNLRRMAGDDLLHLEEMPAPDAHDVIVVLDTGAWAQLEPLRPWLEARRERIIGLDHHPRGDDVAALRFIDPTAASATMLIAELLDAMNLPLTGGRHSVAEALFLGLATDTGWFRHNNADARAFSLASRLMAEGVEKARIYRIIEENHPPRRLAIEARVLESLQYALNGRVAMMSLSREDFRELGASLEDLTGLVNLPMVVEGVQAAVLFAQAEPGRTKLSFRAKPADPETLNSFIDVNELASKFGGGGHTHAAGARIDLELPEAQQAVQRELAKLQSRFNPSEGSRP